MEPVLAAFLWICSISDSGAIKCAMTPQVSMEECQKNVGIGKFSTPSGGDMQVSAAMFCAPTDNAERDNM